MTTCRDIITHAMRELGVIGVGKQPRATESAEGMYRLQSIIDGLFGTALGGKLVDQIVEADTDLTADTRALVYASAPITVSFPEMPFDGARMQIKDMLGNFSTYPLTIEAIPTDLTLSASNGDWTFLYTGATATWSLISPLTLDSSPPLNDSEFLTLALAKQLAPMFGVQFSPASEVALTRAFYRVRVRYLSSVDAAPRPTQEYF